MSEHDLVEHTTMVDDPVPFPRTVWGGDDNRDQLMFHLDEEFDGWEGFVRGAQDAAFALVDAYEAQAPAADRVKIITDLFEAHATKGLFMLYQVLAIIAMRKLVRRRERVTGNELAKRLGIEAWNPPVDEEVWLALVMFMIGVAIDDQQHVRRVFAQQALARDWRMLQALVRAAVVARGK